MVEVFALVVLSGAALVPAAVRRLGAVDVTRTIEPTPLVPTPIEPPDSRLDADAEVEEEVNAGPAESKPVKSRRQLLVHLLWHTAVFGIAVVLGLIFLRPVTPESVLGIGREAILPFRAVIRAVIRAVTGSFDIVALLAAALRVWGIL